jgi:2,4-dienoyl-CoA reductase-like NADH-dependent reductase (Old Yellow Enzyme family)/thioredoxin reductase
MVLPVTGRLSYQRLLSPGRIGPLDLRNRIVMPAMDQNLCTSDGLVTDNLIAHYRDRAAGGVGLLILETSAVAYPAGATSRHQPALSSDACIPGLGRLAATVHDHGSALLAQICHHGKVARIDTLEGRPLLVADLPLPHPRAEVTDITPEELTRIIAVNGARRPVEQAATADDLNAVVQHFAAAARRVQAAGLDGVEVHGGHGYLISNFLSPFYNHRSDDYGGSTENRARLLTEVIGAVRRACGDGFAIIVRLDGREYGTESAVGTTPELAAAYAARAADAGADAIHVSASSTNSMGPGFTDGPLPWQPGQYLDHARAVKQAVAVPVIAVGRISPDLAEKTLARGDTCDFVSMGRQLLADPTIPNRLADGQAELIRTCINCYVCVAQNFWDGTPVCAINTRLGYYDQRTEAPQHPRKVVVVGGGPAGLEAARVAAGRGHRVVLMERDQLGGTARLSSLTTPDNAELVRYLTNAARQAGVEFRLGVDADLALVTKEQPDAVIVATGALRVRPDVPGGELPNVLSGDDLRSALTGQPVPGMPRRHRWLLQLARRSGVLNDIARLRTLSQRWMPIGRNVVVIGGGLVGVELAEFLVERGRKVTLIEPGSQIGAEMALPRRWRAVQRLTDHGVSVERNSVPDRIDEDAVSFVRDGQQYRVAADHVVYAGGVVPDSRLADELRGAGLDVQTAGDCERVGYIQGAIHSGAAAANRI